MKPRFVGTLLKSVVGAAVALGCLQPLTAQNPAAQSPAPPLSIVVEPQQKRLHQYQPIDLRVEVVNTSKAVQSFQVMTCSWPVEWEASDPRISVPCPPCWANARVTITLAPGEAYKKTLEMHQWPVVGKPIGPGRLCFRIGFVPEGNRKFLRGRVIESAFWSEPVTLDIIK